MDVSPLQFGALGLLALVLAGFGVALRMWYSGVCKQTEEQGAFILEVAQSALQSQREHAKAWKEMTETTLQQQVAFTELLTTGFDQQEQWHGELQAELGRLPEAVAKRVYERLSKKEVSDDTG
jgi:hypothetical protein